MQSIAQWQSNPLHQTILLFLTASIKHLATDCAAPSPYEQLTWHQKWRRSWHNMWFSSIWFSQIRL